MKTWRRGRKPASPEQLKEAKERQRQRVKITNIVSRDETIERKCCICGKDNAEILHNTENPHLIAFLCKSCRNHKYNIKLANLFRFDLKQYKQEQIINRDTNYYLNTKKLSKEEVKDIITGYIAPSNTLTMGEYAEGLGLSRYQFNSVVERYKEYFPEDEKVKDRILSRSKAVQRYRLSIAKKNRDMTKEFGDKQISEKKSQNI